MTGVVGNLVYRVSVSAIVGAIVAGGIIYLNNERVVKSYKAEMASQIEQQSMTNKALMEANEELASAIGAIEGENALRIAEFSEELKALTVKIDAIPQPEAADYSSIIEAISAANAGILAKLDAMQVQEQ